MSILAALALLLVQQTQPDGYMTPPQQDADLQVQQDYEAAQRQMQSPPQSPVQAAPVPAGKHAVRDLRRRLEDAGDLYEALGRCAGSLSIEEVQALLAGARDGGPAGAYLTGRFEAGFRKPKDDDKWCHETVDKLSAKL